MLAFYNCHREIFLYDLRDYHWHKTMIIRSLKTANGLMDRLLIFNTRIITER